LSSKAPVKPVTAWEGEGKAHMGIMEEKREPTATLHIVFENVSVILLMRKALDHCLLSVSRFRVL
jgi:hypothetical protein